MYFDRTVMRETKCVDVTAAHTSKRDEMLQSNEPALLRVQNVSTAVNKFTQTGHTNSSIYPNVTPSLSCYLFEPCLNYDFSYTHSRYICLFDRSRGRRQVDTFVQFKISDIFNSIFAKSHTPVRAHCVCGTSRREAWTWWISSLIHRVLTLKSINKRYTDCSSVG